MTKDRDWDAFSAIRAFIDNKIAQDIALPFHRVDL